MRMPRYALPQCCESRASLSSFPTCLGGSHAEAIGSLRATAFGFGTWPDRDRMACPVPQRLFFLGPLSALYLPLPLDTPSWALGGLSSVVSTIPLFLGASPKLADNKLMKPAVRSLRGFQWKSCNGKSLPAERVQGQGCWGELDFAHAAQGRWRERHLGGKDGARDVEGPRAAMLPCQFNKKPGVLETHCRRRDRELK